MEQDSPVFERLEDQLEWYSEKSRSNQRWFKLLKVIEIIAAALIPFVAGLGPYLGMMTFPLITGGLGVVVVVLESLQSLYPRLQMNPSGVVWLWWYWNLCKACTSSSTTG